MFQWSYCCHRLSGRGKVTGLIVDPLNAAEQPDSFLVSRFALISVAFSAELRRHWLGHAPTLITRAAGDELYSINAISVFAGLPHHSSLIYPPIKKAT
ncbi:hypothetical protein NUG10_002520 [Yersinia enterocolitica]|nr:hypothetical protein [Yersinia enterocolitica]EKN3872852.1 hypothetical protein [Yersinia enterocolitica]